MFGQGQLVFMVGGIAIGYVFHPVIAKILALLGHKATVAAPTPTPAPAPTPAPTPAPVPAPKA